MKAETRQTLSVALDWRQPTAARVQAARRLADIGDADVVTPLSVLFSETTAALHEAVGSTLRRLEASAWLVRQLGAPLPEARISAAQILGMLGDPSAAPALARCLFDPHPRMREESASALAKLRDPRALPALEELLIRDAKPDVRAAAAQAIAALPGDEATLALERALSVEPDPFTSSILERALDRRA